MANKFQVKRTTTSGLLPNTTNSSNTSYIAPGELAINLTDEKMVSSNGSATFEIGANLTNLSVANQITVTEKLNVGDGSGLGYDFGALALVEADGNKNSYLQFTMQNANTGEFVSSDFVVVSDDGTDTTNYADFGINGSNYAVPEFGLSVPYDGYLYTSSGNLLLGSVAAKDVIFHTGGANAVHERARITNSGELRVGNTTTNTSITPTTINTGVLTTTNLEVTDSATINTNSITIGNSSVNTIISSALLDIGGELNANGGVGSAGQVLKSGGSGANAYWDTVSGGTGSPGGTDTQVQFNDASSFGGDAGLTYNKTTDALTVAGSVLVGANVIANTSALLVGNSSVNAVLTQSSFDIDGTIAAGNTTLVGFINVSSTANVGGAVNLRGTLAVNGAVTVPNTAALGNTTVTGFINVSSTANVGGATTLRGTATVNGALTVANTAALGNTTVTGFINVSSTANVGGDTNLRGTLTVNGAVTIANTLGSGNTSTANLSVTGFANVSGTANVGGATNLRGDATVNGALTVANTAALGNTTITGFANVTTTLAAGNTTITGFANVTGAVYSGAAITDATQLATKQYVDASTAAGIHVHESVRLETPSAISSTTYTQGGTTPTITAITTNDTLTSVGHGLSVGDIIVFGSTTNGLTAGTAYVVESVATDTFKVSLTYIGAPVTTLTNGTGLSITSRANAGVGAKLTNAGTQAALVIDDVAVAYLDRVSIRLQANAAHNGIYFVSNTGSVSTNWELTRTSDANKYGPTDPNNLGGGDYFYTREGTVMAGDSHVLSTEGIIIFGTTNLVFNDFYKTVPYTGSAPINIASTTISFVLPGASNTQVQFNDSATINSSSGFTFNKTSNTLAVSNTIQANAITLGANVSLNTSAYFVGNSTVNTAIASALLTLGGQVNANGGVGTSGQVLTSGAAGNVYWSTVSAGAIGGANTQILFNDSGSSNGSAAFIFNKSTNTVVVSNTLQVTNKLQVGPTTGYDFSAVAELVVDGNSNTYLQSVTQNSNTGNNASSEFVATADSGNDSVNFVSFGINGSAYNQAAFNIGGPLDAYLYSSNSDLTIGTAANNGAIVFHANGTTSTNEIARINTTGLIVGNTTIASAVLTLGGQVNANGGVGTAGQVLKSGGAGNSYWDAAGGTPGGTNTQIQYNDSGAFGGSAGFTFDESTNNITVANTISTANLSVSGVFTLATDSIQVGNATVNTAITNTDFTKNGVSVVPFGQQSIWIPAVAMYTQTTTGAASGTVEATTNDQMIRTFDFDTTTQEFVQFAIQMPKSWDLGTIVARFVWSHAATTTNFGVAWQIQGYAYSDAVAIDQTWGTAQVVTDTGGTTNALYLSPETAAVTIGGTPGAEEHVIFRVARVPANAGDTMAIDARLHGVRIHYTTNAASDT